MNEIKIAPSILAANPAKMGDELKKIEDAGADYVHIDIMDAHFVPNLAFSPAMVKAFKPLCKLPFDVHLMITDPKKYIPVFAEAGADIITVHQEVTEDLGEMADFIHQFGVKAGISVKPGTPVEVLEGYIDTFDLVLIMTVEPGFGGQSYIEAMNEKIAKARQMIEKTGKAIELEIDGGVTPANVATPVSYGANVAVAGSAVFNAADAAAVISEMRANAR
ncbi:MAG: ribulose-phosphate 3-epimerase [Ruminococcaceae bacterium]|nr:ribulose-phosphate 3-epimerase [Oscillospiraceae bacterium]